MGSSQKHYTYMSPITKGMEGPFTTRREARDSANIFTSCVLYIPIEAKVMRGPTSKSPGEREFLVGSGASMHMMSNKDLSSDKLDTVRRSRNPTVVLAANGEVHTNEEGQVYVHDLNLFATVQLLEETLAVLSLGKLCEDHGYSAEWVSGQKPRLTKEGKSIACKTDNFVPLVVPGLSTGSGSNSSSTSTSQDLCSESPALERSGELATREWCGSSSKTKTKLKRGDDSRDADDRLRDLSEWLEEFTDNLVDTELHAPAHISQDSDSERLTKVVLNSRKHSIYTHFPKDRNCDVCLRTKMKRALGRRRTGEALLRAEKFGDLITADHKDLNEEGQSRNNHRYAAVVQDLATQWIQSCQCKTKTSQETEKRLRKFPEPCQEPKVIYADNSLEFGISCEDLSWNHRTITPHRSETNCIAE